METNIETIKVTGTTTHITKKCSCCGKLLLLSDFNKTGKGYMKICKICKRKETGASSRFEIFTSLELIDELKSRGYKGTLSKTIVETIKV